MMKNWRTWRKHGRSHRNDRVSRMFWDGLCNQIEQRSLLSIYRKPIACEHCVSCGNAFWFRPDLLVRGTGCGGDKSAQDTHKLSFSPLHLSSLSSVASMVLYAFFYASGDSDPSETLGCRSRTRTDLTLATFVEIKIQPLHLDLLPPIHKIWKYYI